MSQRDPRSVAEKWQSMHRPDSQLACLLSLAISTGLSNRSTGLNSTSLNSMRCIGGFVLVLLAALATLASAGRLTSPPVISLSLSEQAAQDIHRVKSDAQGRPCNSVAADQKSCSTSQRHVYYKFCHVMDDTAETCELPSAQAHDHHEGALPVVTTVFLHVRSDPHKSSFVVDARANDNQIDFKQRGEYYINYDAMDHSGNKATTVSFHVFLVDHEPPTIAVASDPITPAARFVQLPITALDRYDGDVTDVAKLQVTQPGGQNTRTVHGAVTIDTELAGSWALRVVARDFASAFGRSYRDNVSHKLGTVEVAGGRVTRVKLGTQVTDVEAPTAKQEAEALGDSGGAHKHKKGAHYVPPVLMLSFGGKLVSRGSPWGVHHTQKAYRAHLRKEGVGAAEIERHVSIITAREERLAKSLGPEAVWKGGELDLHTRR